MYARCIIVLAHEHVYCRRSLVLNGSLCNTSTQKKSLLPHQKLGPTSYFHKCLPTWLHHTASLKKCAVPFHVLKLFSFNMHFVVQGEYAVHLHTSHVISRHQNFLYTLPTWYICSQYLRTCMWFSFGIYLLIICIHLYLLQKMTQYTAIECSLTYIYINTTRVS